MRRIVNGPEMKALDRYTIDRMDVPSCVLMERAALAVVDEMERHFADTKQKERILCVCGGGNNGGDGVACARLLRTAETVLPLPGSCTFMDMLPKSI